MNNTIRFAKLFRVIQEGEYFHPSIVAYQKIPIKFDAFLQEDGSVKTCVVECLKRLYINLWFVQLEFEWKVTL